MVASRVHASICEKQDLNGEWSKVGTFSHMNPTLSVASENENFVIFETWVIVSKKISSVLSTQSTQSNYV